MKITVPEPTREASEKSIKSLAYLLKQFQQIKREENHLVEIPPHLETDPLLSTPLTLLLLQYQKAGYLFQSKSIPNFKNHLILSGKKNAVDFEKLFLVSQNWQGRKDIFNALYYILGELADNVFDHARAEVAVIGACTQNDYFSFAVADNGISIPGAYRSAHIPIQDDCEALIKALHGFSTKTVEERGTGLPSTRKLIHNAFQGQLLICSAGALLKDKGELKCSPLPFYWQGTVVFVEGKFPQDKLNLYEIIAP